MSNTTATWHAALDDASRNLAIDGIQLKLINAFEAMAPHLDDDGDRELLYNTNHSLDFVKQVSSLLEKYACAKFKFELDIYHCASSSQQYHRMVGNLKLVIDWFTGHLQSHDNT